MEQKCIIFGAGNRGIDAYNKLSLFFEVAAYADNNPELWGQQRYGVTIIPPNDLPKFAEEKDMPVFIANALHYEAIADQLDMLHLQYYLFDFRLCYERVDRVWYPASPKYLEPYRKSDPEKFAVLFVQHKPCARTDKIAHALKSRGILTYAVYSYAPSEAGASSYEKEFAIWSYAELLDFVNQSEFDIIHCSNEPDIFVNVLIDSNKAVIHDCHDLRTLAYKELSAEGRVLEYLANTRADGFIYTTDPLRDIVCRMYGTPRDKTFVLGNYPISSFDDAVRLPKLSASDGQIHCVYEGGILDQKESADAPFRFYEPMFVKLADSGVHIHIYSHCSPDYLKRLDREYTNIHYDGNYNGIDLISRMTQYDLGLALYPTAHLPVTCSASPNKICEYLSAGLPVVTNVVPYADFAAKYGCGGMLDMEGDIVAQMLRYKGIKIPQDFCSIHGLTMDANVERILTFYQKVLNINSKFRR